MRFLLQIKTAPVNGCRLIDGFILLQSAACVKSQAVLFDVPVTEQRKQFHMGHDSEHKRGSVASKRGLQAPFGWSRPWHIRILYNIQYMYKSTMYHRRYDNITNIQNWYRSTMYHGRYDTITVLQTLPTNCFTDIVCHIQTLSNNWFTDIVKQLIYRHR